MRVYTLKSTNSWSKYLYIQNFYHHIWHVLMLCHVIRRDIITAGKRFDLVWSISFAHVGSIFIFIFVLTSVFRKNHVYIVKQIKLTTH